MAHGVSIASIVRCSCELLLSVNLATRLPGVCNVKNPPCSRRADPYQKPSAFHHPTPIVPQTASVTSDTMKPSFHHSRCVTYCAPK